MTVLTATAAFNTAALNTLLNINGPASDDLINAHLLRLTAPPYRYDLGGTFTNILNPLANHVTSLTVYYTPPAPDQLMYSMTGFNVTVGQVIAATTATALKTLFFGGADTINGSNFADSLFGFAGPDTIKGNGGADRLTGGVGKDTLNGGLLGDIFDFNAKAESTPVLFDTIQLFNHAQGDRIDLSTIDATTGGANNAFLFAGAQTFAAFNAAHAGGAVRAVAGVVQVDIDGNNTVDMVIKTPGATLHLADFIL